MKDKELILRTHFGLIDLIAFKIIMEERGWVIVTNQINSSTHVIVYESEDDHSWEEPMCSALDFSFEKAFLACLMKIQEYYKTKSI